MRICSYAVVGVRGFNFSENRPSHQQPYSKTAQLKVDVNLLFQKTNES